MLAIVFIHFKLCSSFTEFSPLYNVCSQNVLWGYLEFVVKDVSDQQTALLDNALRMVSQLLTSWKTSVTNEGGSGSGGGSSTNKPTHVRQVWPLTQFYYVGFFC